MSEVFTWDPTSANNNSAPPNGWPEGMQYSSVNNAAREMMGSIARLYKDTNGTLVSGGTTTAFTLTPNQTLTSYIAGQLFRFQASHTSTGLNTLNVSALGAKSLIDQAGNTTTTLTSGFLYFVIYNGTSFILSQGDDSALRTALASLTDPYGTALVGHRGQTVRDVFDGRAANIVQNGRFEAVWGSAAVALTTSPVISQFDGWYAFQNTSAASTISQVAFGATGFLKAVKLQRNVGSSTTGSIILLQSYKTDESVPSAGKACSIAFKLKAGANFSGTNVNIAVFAGRGTDENPAAPAGWTGVTTPVATTRTVTTAAATHTIEFTFPSDATQMAVRFYYDPIGTAGADDSLQITDVQVRGLEPPASNVKAPRIEMLYLRQHMAKAGRYSNMITDGIGDPFPWGHYVPYNGRYLWIAGQNWPIADGVFVHSGGWQMQYNNCYIDRVPNQSAADNTIYFIFACIINGQPVLQLSQTGYLQNDSTYGMPLKIDDPGSTLVAYCRVRRLDRGDGNGVVATVYGNARAQTVIGYFHPFYAKLATAVNGAITATSATKLQDGSTLPISLLPQDNYSEWVQFYDSAPAVRFYANGDNNGAGVKLSLGLGINTKVAISGPTFTAVTPVAGGGGSVNISGEADPSDATGYYFAQMMGFVGSGTSNVSGRLFVGGGPLAL